LTLSNKLRWLIRSSLVIQSGEASSGEYQVKRKKERKKEEEEEDEEKEEEEEEEATQRKHTNIMAASTMQGGYNNQ